MKNEKIIKSGEILRVKQFDVFGDVSLMQDYPFCHIYPPKDQETKDFMDKHSERFESVGLTHKLISEKYISKGFLCLLYNSLQAAKKDIKYEKRENGPEGINYLAYKELSEEEEQKVESIEFILFLLHELIEK